MNKRAVFFVLFLCAFWSAESSCSGNRMNDGLSSPWMPADQVGALAKWLSEQPYLYYTGITLGGLYVVSKIQKDNPDFFNSITRTLEWPFFVMQQKLQKMFCDGKSLTWNELASWHNRVYRLLSPFTKATSVVDLSKGRRLRAMDAQDNPEEVDELWIKQVIHIEREIAFLISVLTVRLRYYEDQTTAGKKKKSQGLIKTAGKAMMRTSLNRNEEIAFGLKEVIVYLSEAVDYCRSVEHSSTLDKEHLKKLVASICAAFEHLGNLVDEVGASDKTKKKIPMTTDGTRGYTGAAAGGYGYGGGDYGASGYGYGA